MIRDLFEEFGDIHHASDDPKRMHVSVEILWNWTEPGLASGAVPMTHALPANRLCRSWRDPGRSVFGRFPPLPAPRSAELAIAATPPIPGCGTRLPCNLATPERLRHAVVG